jgi:hypothetical protein
VVYCPLEYIHMDTINVISFWGPAGTYERHLHSGLQSHAQVIITSHISCIVLQGILMQLEGINQPHLCLCLTARAVRSCCRDQVPYEIEVTLFLSSKVLIKVIEESTDLILIRHICDHACHDHLSIT